LIHFYKRHGVNIISRIMPPLQLFGRDWRVGSDDFVCPAITEFLIRSGWLVVFTGVIIFHLRETATLSCLGGGAEYHETTAYLVTTMVLLTLSCISVALLGTNSSKGTITQSEARRWVPFFLYLNMFLNTVELLWTICGTAFTINDFLKCKDEMHARTVIIAVLVIIGLTYVLLFFKFLFFLASFKPFGRVRVGETESLLSERHSRETDLNYRGLRCCACAPCTQDENTVQAFKDIASLLSKLLHDRDLVPTDIVTGLILLHYSADRERERLSQDSSGRLRRPLSSIETEATDLGMEEVAYFYQFASAAYGYWWWLLAAPCAHMCSLGAYLNCCPAACCCRKRSSCEPSVRGDGIFHCNLAAIKAMLDVSEQDIIAFDNRNSLEEVPFFVAADRRSRSIVISIRGTLSLQDMLTDLRGEPLRIVDAVEELGGLPPSWKGHQGMVNAASFVFRRLHGLCPKDKKEGRALNLLGLTLTNPEYRGFRLVVTGHSLGAGTAAILSFLLRAKYPGVSVSCLAYSPPGGLVSRAAREESRQFCVSVVVGDDVIPRTSINSIANLGLSIRGVVSRCRLPKYKVLGYGLLGCCSCSKHRQLQAEVERLQEQQQDSPASSGSDRGTDSQVLISVPSVQPLRSIEEMYLPGRVLHVTREPTGSGFSAAEVGPDFFSDILVSPTMMSDHMPNYLHKVFSSMVQRSSNGHNMQI